VVYIDAPPLCPVRIPCRLDCQSVNRQRQCELLAKPCAKICMPSQIFVCWIPTHSFSSSSESVHALCRFPSHSFSRLACLNPPIQKGYTRVAINAPQGPCARHFQEHEYEWNYKSRQHSTSFSTSLGVTSFDSFFIMVTYVQVMVVSSASVTVVVKTANEFNGLVCVQKTSCISPTCYRLASTHRIRSLTNMQTLVKPSSTYGGLQQSKASQFGRGKQRQDALQHRA